MKKLFLFIAALVFATAAFCQTKYYKGEWTKGNSTYLFKSFIKLDFSADKVKGEIIWTIARPDELDSFSQKYYVGKLNMSGVEVVEGYYNAKTNDLSFLGLSKIDPNGVIGTDIYSLKISADGNALYGKTDANGKGNGYFYATAALGAEGEYNAMRAKIK